MDDSEVVDGSASDKCYKFGFTTPIATMSNKRSYAVSAAVNNKLWVVGGENEHAYYLTSTELVDPATGSVEFGPVLPKPSQLSCIVLINTTAMLIGGYPDPTDKTWTYNFEREEQGWVPGPHLNAGRQGHACGIVKDSANDGKTIVIAAGGWDGWLGLRSTEYFVIGSNQWRAGPDLKYRIFAASGVTNPDGKSFLFVGGKNYDKSEKREDTIYKLECHNLICMWTQVDKKLGVGRYLTLATFFPDSLLGCN